MKRAHDNVGLHYSQGETIADILFLSLNLGDSDEVIVDYWGKEFQLVVKRLSTKLLFNDNLFKRTTYTSCIPSENIVPQEKF